MRAQLPRKSRSSFHSILISMLLSLSLSACVVEGPPGPHYAPAPYYGYYDYYYYPNVGVYFQISTGYYFYFEHNRWIKVRVLPSYIHLSPTYRVRMTIKDKVPYHHHSEHLKTYKPIKSYHPDRRLDQKERKDNRKLYDERKKDKRPAKQR